MGDLLLLASCVPWAKHIGLMKMLNENLLIARGEYTQSQKWIQTLVNLSSGDGEKIALHATAIWDTGSTDSGISNILAAKLGLEWTGTKAVRDVNEVTKIQPKYDAFITFPQSGRKIRMEFVGFDGGGQDVLIGMDVIRHGMFIVEPKSDGGFTFAFYKERIEHEE